LSNGRLPHWRCLSFVVLLQGKHERDILVGETGVERDEEIIRIEARKTEVVVAEKRHATSRTELTFY
jgi:hypothetical protein